MQRLSRFLSSTTARLCQMRPQGTRWLSSVSDTEPMSSEYWREAASIILAAKDSASPGVVEDTDSDTPPITATGSDDSKYDYKILLLQRHEKSKFMPGANVFPGGTACEADFSIDWANVFTFITKRDLGDIIKDLDVGVVRPPMLSRNRHAGIPPDLGFRIAAIRETFEESGVLLVKGARMRDITDAQLDEFRQKITLDPRKFGSFCKDLQVVPDIWALKEWNNWLTPVSPGQKDPQEGTRNRFDTVFYLCCLDWIPLVQCDEKETVDAKWISPNYVLDPQSTKDLRGPQQFELARMYNFHKLAFLHTFSQQRARLGTERYMSVYIECQDGMLAVLPGDDLYPDKPDFEGLKGLRRMPQTLEEIRGATKRHHRQELKKDSDEPLYVCNVEPRYGLPGPNKKLQQIKYAF